MQVLVFDFSISICIESSNQKYDSLNYSHLLQINVNISSIIDAHQKPIFNPFDKQNIRQLSHSLSHSFFLLSFVRLISLCKSTYIGDKKLYTYIQLSDPIRWEIETEANILNSICCCSVQHKMKRAYNWKLHWQVGRQCQTKCHQPKNRTIVQLIYN